MALWCGLVYGVAEGALAFGLSMVPGVLTWHNGNSAPILFVAPVFYALLFLVATLPIALAARWWPRLNWERFWLSALVGLSGFCLAMLDGQIFSLTTSQILGVAAAVVFFRYLKRHQESFRRLVQRTLPGLAGLVSLAGIGLVGAIYAREAWILRKLPATNPNQPNVILLVMDTERADHLSSYGYGRLTTPYLDSLALESVRFEQAYSAAPWTLPSHASMMTGRSLREHGAGSRTLWNLDRRYPTLAEELQKAGYATGGFVSNLFWTGRSTGLNRGFIHYEDYFRNLADDANRTVFGRLILFPVIEWLSSDNDIPGRRRAAQINGEMLRWIDRVKGRPFFAFANYNDVHQPYHPAKGFEGHFGSVRDRRRFKSLEIGAFNEDQSVPPPAVIAEKIALYDESLFAMDRAIGGFIDSLRTRHLLEHTLLIVVADHGEHFGEHGIMSHGQSLYEQEIHVPLIIRDVGPVRPGIVVGQPVSATDIPATIADRAGLARGIFPGASLLQPVPGRPGPVLSEIRNRNRPKGFRTVETGEAESLVEGNWHFIAHASGKTELFDRVGDPGESHDLSDSLPLRSVVAGFQQSLRDMKKEGGPLVIGKHGDVNSGSED